MVFWKKCSRIYNFFGGIVCLWEGLTIFSLGIVRGVYRKDISETKARPRYIIESVIWKESNNTGDVWRFEGRNQMCKIDIHADDYALSLMCQEDILQCLRVGS